MLSPKEKPVKVHRLSGIRADLIEVSERQWTDVLGVRQVRHHDLHDAYLERVAEERNVLQLLQRAIVDAQEQEKYHAIDRIRWR